ncbi:MAG: hypothetical protein ACYSUV_19785 [Planctomycetota bacterium]|jgi:hypothetical protein
MNQLWRVEFTCDPERNEYIEYVVSGEVEGAVAVVRSVYRKRSPLNIQKVELVAERLLERLDELADG